MKDYISYDLFQHIKILFLASLTDWGLPHTGQLYVTCQFCSFAGMVEMSLLKRTDATGNECFLVDVRLLAISLQKVDFNERKFGSCKNVRNFITTVRGISKSTET